MPQGSASTVIDSDPQTVFAVVSDITRTGEWSPECTAGRWAGGASGPMVGATFEGDNQVKIAGLTVKRWTTTSEVTACTPGEVFEFVAEGYTTWRYDIAPSGTGTLLTESFNFEFKTGREKFLYGSLLRRSDAMTKGMQQTLERIKASIERS